MDTKIKYVSDDRRYKIVIIILVSIIVLFYVAIPIYRKLYDKFFIYYKKENPSISTGIGLYGKPEKTSVYDEATGTYTVSYTVEYKINVGAPVVSFTCTYDFRDKDGVVQDTKTSNPVVINECPDDKLTIVFEKVRIDPASYRSVDMNVVYAKSFYEEGLEKLSPFDRWLKENPWVWALFVVPYRYGRDYGCHGKVFMRRLRPERQGILEIRRGGRILADRRADTSFCVYQIRKRKTTKTHRKKQKGTH